MTDVFNKYKPLDEKVYKINARDAPVKLNATGSNLKKCGTNSASIAFKFNGNTNKALFQKGEPNPINKSRDKYPIKILGIDKINKGLIRFLYNKRFE